MGPDILRLRYRKDTVLFAPRRALSGLREEIRVLDFDSPELRYVLKDQDSLREVRRYWFRHFRGTFQSGVANGEFGRLVELAIRHGQCEAAILQPLPLPLVDAGITVVNRRNDHWLPESLTPELLNRQMPQKLPQMKAEHIEIFRDAARFYQVFILVRRTNLTSLRHLGEASCVPKRLDCKAKTADNDYTHPQYGLMRSAGLVVDPTVTGRSAFRTQRKYEAATEEWKKFAASMIQSDVSTLEGQRKLTYVPNGGFYFVDLNPLSARYGCLKIAISSLITAGKYIHGDYDLYGIVPMRDPWRNVAVMETRLGQRHARSPEFFDVQHYINRKVGVPMVQHGAQESYADGHSEEGLDIFHPDGSISFTESARDTSLVYQNLFRGRQLFTREGPTDFARAGFVPAQLGLPKKDVPETPPTPPPASSTSPAAPEPLALTPQAQALIDAAQSGVPFCEECAKLAAAKAKGGSGYG